MPPTNLNGRRFLNWLEPQTRGVDGSRHSRIIRLTFKGRLLMPHFVVRRVAAILPMSQKTSLTQNTLAKKLARMPFVTAPDVSRKSNASVLPWCSDVHLRPPKLTLRTIKPSYTAAIRDPQAIVRRHGLDWNGPEYSNEVSQFE